MPLTDLDLLAGARSGDEAAFHELVNRHAEYLYGIARSLTGNAADAEDVVQETFAAAFKGVAGFRGASSVRTWLVRILVRQSARSRRSFWRRKIVLLGDAQDGRMETAVASKQDQADRQMDVMAMLQELSAEHREVLVLRELQGMSYGEIAEALGVPQGTVESRLFRARQEMRTRFKEYG